MTEAGATPCVVLGKDLGELFYALGVLGWLSLATIPAGALAALVAAVFLSLRRRGR